MKKNSKNAGNESKQTKKNAFSLTNRKCGYRITSRTENLRKRILQMQAFFLEVHGNVTMNRNPRKYGIFILEKERNKKL